MAICESEPFIRRYIEDIWNRGDAAAIDNYLAKNYRRYTVPGIAPLTLAQQKQRIAALRAAFPDMQVTLEDIIGGAERLAFRVTLRGTHSNTFLGIARTGRTVVVTAVDFCRIEHDKIVEQWGGPDLLGLLLQLGAAVVAEKPAGL